MVAHPPNPFDSYYRAVNYSLDHFSGSGIYLSVDLI